MSVSAVARPISCIMEANLLQLMGSVRGMDIDEGSASRDVTQVTSAAPHLKFSRAM